MIGTLTTTRILTVKVLRINGDQMASRVWRVNIDSVYHNCFWCKHYFLDGETVTYVTIERKRGAGTETVERAMCEKCLGKIKEEK